MIDYGDSLLCVILDLALTLLLPNMGGIAVAWLVASLDKHGNVAIAVVRQASVELMHNDLTWRGEAWQAMPSRTQDPK